MKLKNWRIRVYQIGFEAKFFCLEMILAEKGYSVMEGIPKQSSMRKEQEKSL